MGDLDLSLCQVTMEEVSKAHMSWSDYHLGVSWKVDYWGIGIMNDGYGIWNRYIIIPEAMIPEEFEELWLEPYDISISKRKCVSYHYESTKLADLRWNGGITFYKKIGKPLALH